jgi:hypothetical protein
MVDSPGGRSAPPGAIIALCEEWREVAGLAYSMMAAGQNPAKRVVLMWDQVKRLVSRTPTRDEDPAELMRIELARLISRRVAVGREPEPETETFWETSARGELQAVTQRLIFAARKRRSGCEPRRFWDVVDVVRLWACGAQTAEVVERADSLLAIAWTELAILCREARREAVRFDRGPKPGGVGLSDAGKEEVKCKGLERQPKGAGSSLEARRAVTDAVEMLRKGKRARVADVLTYLLEHGLVTTAELNREVHKENGKSSAVEVRRKVERNVARANKALENTRVNIRQRSAGAGPEFWLEEVPHPPESWWNP